MTYEQSLQLNSSFLSKTVGIAAFALMLSGCSSFDVLNVTTPSGHYNTDKELSYGPHLRQKIDVYVPTTKATATSPDEQDTPLRPLVIFFYGGGWNYGDKANYEFVAAALTKNGFNVMIPNYRLHPEIKFPAFVEDGAKAVAWALAHAKDYGADPNNTYLMGHSAGAHIAAMLALNDQYLSPYNINPSELAGFIGLSGPYNFLPIGEGYLQEVFPQQTRDSSQPINFVTAKSPRTLLIHGTKDETVYFSNSETLAAQLAKNNVPVTLKRYEDIGHAKVVAAFAGPLGFLADSLKDTTAFIQQGETRAQ